MNWRKYCLLRDDHVPSEMVDNALLKFDANYVDEQVLLVLDQDLLQDLGISKADIIKKILVLANELTHVSDNKGGGGNKRSKTRKKRKKNQKGNGSVSSMSKKNNTNNRDRINVFPDIPSDGHELASSHFYYQQRKSFNIISIKKCGLLSNNASLMKVENKQLCNGMKIVLKRLKDNYQHYFRDASIMHTKRIKKSQSLTSRIEHDFFSDNSQFVTTILKVTKMELDQLLIKMLKICEAFRRFNHGTQKSSLTQGMREKLDIIRNDYVHLMI